MKFVIYSIIAVLAIVAAVIAFNLSNQSNPTNVATGTTVNEINVKTVDVLVARNNIPVGSIIDNSMIDRQPWPENLVLEGFIVNDNSGQDNIVGKVVRSPIQAHEPFMKSKLANPNDPGFLAANLPVGMRAITIATDTVSGIAGFVFPGDRVDLLFTHNPIPANSRTASNGPEFTEVLGSNVRVLAVNIRDGGDPSRPAPVAPASVTVEVNDALAQQVRLAEKNGTLSLALRSIKDDTLGVPVPTGINDLTHANTSKPMSLVYGPGTAGGPIRVVYTDGTPSDASQLTPGIISGIPSDPNLAVGAPVVQPGSPVINNNAAK